VPAQTSVRGKRKVQKMTGNNGEPNWTKKTDWPTITFDATLDHHRPAFLRYLTSPIMDTRWTYRKKHDEN
jgi:hypothetical protein